MRDRRTLIALIHVARRQLALDDADWRTLLDRLLPGKTSCRELSLPELEQALTALRAQGFRSRPARRRPARVTDKIRVIWRIMQQQGFITDGSDAALDAFVQRTTRRRNDGIGVMHLDWLRGEQAALVLECLKRWHRRCMLTHLPVSAQTCSYEQVCALYRQRSQ